MCNIQVNYVCSAAGCKYFGGRRDDNPDAVLPAVDVLVVKRSTKTVRAVELQTGIEKYVELSLLLFKLCS